MRQLAWICTLCRVLAEIDRLPECLDVVGTVSTAREIRQVKLNLIPTLIEPHGHGADEGLDTGGRLVVRGTEAPADVLVIQNLDLEREVFLQL